MLEESNARLVIRIMLVMFGLAGCVSSIAAFSFDNRRRSFRLSRRFREWNSDAMLMAPQPFRFLLANKEDGCPALPC